MSTPEPDGKQKAPWWKDAPTLVVLGFFAALVVAFAIWKVADNREQAQQTDGLYCTLSGVGPLDRAPETGELCADVIEKGW